jgi:hypothetical protein
MTTEKFLTSIFQESGISRMILNIEKNIKLAEDYLVDFQKISDEIEEQSSTHFLATEEYYQASDIYEDMLITDDEIDEFENRMNIECDLLVNIMEKYGLLLKEFCDNFGIEKIEMDLAKKIQETYSFIDDTEHGEYFFIDFPELASYAIMMDEYINKY